MTIDNTKDLYNESTKRIFLEEMLQKGVLSVETTKSYERIFIKTANQEEVTGKDLNQFSLEELEKIFYNFNSNNRNTIESYGRIISSYFNWSVNIGKSKCNPLAELKPSDFEKYLINEETYITLQQLHEYENQCVNYQDSVILHLLFIGVGGKKISEIRNLNKKDIDWENGRLRLVNSLKEDIYGNPLKFTERYINVCEQTLKLIDGAINRHTYEKSNGTMIMRDNIRPYTDLVKNDYVVRASITKTEENWNKPVDKYVIYRRIDSISKSIGIDLTAKFIQRSGMINQARKLIKDDEISLNDLKMVADRFHITSYHNLKGYVNLKNIRKTYLDVV